VGRRANPLPRPAGGMSAAGCPAVTMPLEAAQEPTGERKGLSAASGIPPPPRNAVEAAAAASTAATGGTPERALSPVDEEPASALGL
jgi:hypothetical protein